MDAASRWFAGVFSKSLLLAILMMIPLIISLLPLSYSGLGIASRRTRTELPLRGLFGRLWGAYLLSWMYLELTIFRTLAEPFLQIFVEKAWSPLSLVQGRKHPLWGTWICSQGPARHRKKILSSNPSEPEAKHCNGSEPDGYQTSYQARCIDRTNRTKQRREALSQSVSCRTHANTHLHASVLFVFSLTIRATSSITSTITSRARSSITLTLFTRSLSVDGRAAALMQTDLIQLLLPIPLAEATSQINDGGDESTDLTTNNQPAIKNMFSTNLD